jgi:hypothetical protein
VHPICQRSNLNLQVTGPAVAVAARHAKVRRGGYRKPDGSESGAAADGSVSCVAERSPLSMRMCRLVDKPGTGRAIGFPPALADDR